MYWQIYYIYRMQQTFLFLDTTHTHFCCIAHRNDILYSSLSYHTMITRNTAPRHAAAAKLLRAKVFRCARRVCVCMRMRLELSH